MNFQSLSMLCVALAAGGAFAQTTPPDPDYALAFNVGLSSDYRFRGITQSRFKPALQAGADFAHKSGFYLGAWASSIHWIRDVGGHSGPEIDLYGFFVHRLRVDAEQGLRQRAGCQSGRGGHQRQQHAVRNVTPSGRFTGRDGAVLGLKYNF